MNFGHHVFWSQDTSLLLICAYCRAVMSCDCLVFLGCVLHLYRLSVGFQIIFGTSTLVYDT